jgi:hypothetical protein
VQGRAVSREGRGEDPSLSCLPPLARDGDRRQPDDGDARRLNPLQCAGVRARFTTSIGNHIVVARGRASDSPSRTSKAVKPYLP